MVKGQPAAVGERGIMKFLRKLFCRHIYNAKERVSLQEGDLVHDSTYIFICKKCGKVKAISTHGIDEIAGMAGEENE